MSWPEYLKGYAGRGILQTFSSLIRPARAVGGKQMHLSIKGRTQDEGGLHRGDKCKEKAAFVHLSKSVGQLIVTPGFTRVGFKHKHHPV